MTEIVEHAKLAEQAERYDDMSKFMKELVLTSAVPLTDEQRNLLSVAFKNVVGARRSAWRITSSIEQRAKEKADDEERTLAAKYREAIEAELVALCEEVLKLIDDNLINSPSLGEEAGTVEAMVFYTKMKGDYLRYITEVKVGDKRTQVAAEAKQAYEKAVDEASKLASTHPIRLGLYLNFSVFCYEIENDAPTACELAKNAFEDAIAELDHLKEESYKDSTLIMQLLRDNLTLWISEKDAEENDDDEDE